MEMKKELAMASQQYENDLTVKPPMYVCDQVTNYGHGGIHNDCKKSER